MYMFVLIFFSRRVIVGTYQLDEVSQSRDGNIQLYQLDASIHEDDGPNREEPFFNSPTLRYTHEMTHGGVLDCKVTKLK